jgi:gentisate 1,2-dioxygenase
MATQWDNTKGYPWCEIVDIDSAVERLLQKDLRPGKWAGEDIRKAMGLFTKDNRRNTDQRRGVTLIHDDLTGSAGMSPGISLSFQPILPGEKLDFHRHNYVAIYYWIEGEGYTANDEDGIDREEHRIYWKAGDVTISPAWINHAHVCTSETPALQLAIHDFPELCYRRAMLSEDPAGAENLRHMVKGVVPSFNNLDTEEELRRRDTKISVTTKVA